VNQFDEGRKGACRRTPIYPKCEVTELIGEINTPRDYIWVKGTIKTFRRSLERAKGSTPHSVKKAKFSHHLETCTLIKKAFMGFREAEYLFYNSKYRKVHGHCVLDLYYKIGVINGVVRVIYIGKSREWIYWGNLRWIEKVIPYQPLSYILIVCSSFISPRAFVKLKEALKKYRNKTSDWVLVLNATLPYFGVSEGLVDRWKAKRKKSWKANNDWFNEHAHEFGMRNRRIRMPKELPTEQFVLHVYHNLKPFWERFIKAIFVVYPQFKLLLRELERHAMKVSDVYSDAFDKIVKIKGSKIKEIEEMVRLLCSEGWAKFIKKWRNFIRYKVGFDPP